MVLNVKYYNNFICVLHEALQYYKGIGSLYTI